MTKLSAHGYIRHRANPEMKMALNKKGVYVRASGYKIRGKPMLSTGVLTTHGAAKIV
ncbi:MAG TPA: hypothetical protein VHX20_11770 [Terracidiphilus sp.]|nr:hypothetical protein [Terracidiphilus sp.]